MTISITTAIGNAMVKKFGTDNKLKGISANRTYWQDSREFEINLVNFKKPVVIWLRETIKALGNPSAELMVKRIDTYLKLAESPETPVGRLQLLTTALTFLIKPTEHKWVQKKEKDGQVCFYYVSNIQYHPPDERSENPAYVEMKLAFIKNGVTKTDSLCW